MTEFDRDSLVAAVDAGISHLAEHDVVDHDDHRLQECIDQYESQWKASLSERAASSGEATVVRDVLLSYLRTTDVVLSYDPQMIFGYDSYCRLVADHVELTDGLLDELQCEADGDWDSGEDGRLTIEFDGATFEGTVTFMDEYVDTAGLYDLLDEVVAEATDDPRRFYLLGADLHTVAFLHPEQSNVLDDVVDSPTAYSTA